MMINNEIQKLLENIHQDLSQNLEIAATDRLCFYLDDLLLHGSFEQAANLLDLLNTDLLPVRMLTGIAMITKAAKIELGQARVLFCQRMRVSLNQSWKLDQAKIKSIFDRLE